MVWGWRLIGACTALFAATGANAQENFKREWLKAQFGGWSGLTFHCEIAENSAQTAEKLCSWATQRVRILGRQSGAPLTVVSSDPYQRVLDKRKVSGNPLDLVVYISTNIPRAGNVTAVYVAVRASPHVSLPPDDKSKGAGPRSGTLVMWETHTIASGMASPELDLALQQSVENNLMKFLNDYADGQQ